MAALQQLQAGLQRAQQAGDAQAVAALQQAIAQQEPAPPPAAASPPSNVMTLERLKRALVIADRQGKEIEARRLAEIIKAEQARLDARSPTERLIDMNPTLGPQAVPL